MTQGMGLGLGGMPPWGRMFQNAGSFSGRFPMGGFSWGAVPGMAPGKAPPNPAAQVAPQGPVKADAQGVQQAFAKLGGCEKQAQGVSEENRGSHTSGPSRPVSPSAVLTGRPGPGRSGAPVGSSTTLPRGRADGSSLPGLPKFASDAEILAALPRLGGFPLSGTRTAAGKEHEKLAAQDNTAAPPSLDPKGIAALTAMNVGGGALAGNKVGTMLAEKHTQRWRNLANRAANTSYDRGRHQESRLLNNFTRNGKLRQMFKRLPRRGRWIGGGIGGGLSLALTLLLQKLSGGKPTADAGTTKPTVDAQGKPITKSAAQDNTAPRLSATGDSSGLTFAHKSDDYAQGQDAWGSLHKYFKGGSKLRSQPSPLTGKHRGEEKAVRQMKADSFLKDASNGGKEMEKDAIAFEALPPDFQARYQRNFASGRTQMSPREAAAYYAKNYETPQQRATRFSSERAQQLRTTPQQKYEAALARGDTGMADYYRSKMSGGGQQFLDQARQQASQAAARIGKPAQLPSMGGFSRNLDAGPPAIIGSQAPGGQRPPKPPSVGGFRPRRPPATMGQARGIPGMPKLGEDLSPFARGFFGCCLAKGMDEGQVKQAMDAAIERFGKLVEEDLKSGFEKCAFFGKARGLLNRGLQWGARKLAPKAMQEGARQAGKAAPQAAKVVTTKVTPYSASRAMVPYSAEFAARQAARQGARRGTQMATRAGLPAATQGGKLALPRAVKGQIGSRLGHGTATGVAQGFAEPALLNQRDPVTGEPTIFSWGGAARGFGLGALLGKNRAVRSWYGRPVTRAGIASIGGEVADTGLGAMGIDTGGRLRQAAAWGAGGLSTPWGRRMMGTAAPKVLSGIDDFAIPRLLPQGAQGAWGRGARGLGRGMSNLTGGRMGKGLMRHGERMIRPESAASKWGRRTLGGSMALAGGTAFAGATMDNLRAQIGDEMTMQFQQQAPAMIKQLTGKTPEELQAILAQADSMGQIGNVLGGMEGIFDKILGFFNADPSSMNLMQKALLVLGGGALLGGALTGSGTMAGVGGLAMAGGLLPMMGGFGGQGAPAGQGAPPPPADPAAAAQPQAQAAMPSPEQQTASMLRTGPDELQRMLERTGQVRPHNINPNATAALQDELAGVA